MSNQMSLSAFVVGFVESALNNRTVQPPPPPEALEALPASLASLVEINTTTIIANQEDNLVERNIDVITGGDF